MSTRPCVLLIVVSSLIALPAPPASADAAPAGPAQARAHKPADIPTGWWSAVQKDLAASEYQVSWQDQPDLPDLPVVCHAANRAQNLRVYFTPAGFRAIPRTTRKGESPAWTWGLSFVGMNPAQPSFAVAPSTPWPLEPSNPSSLCVDRDRVEYDHGNVIEWYINDSRGLEQGFTILRKPSAVSDQPSANDGKPAIRKEFTRRGGQSEIRLTLAVTGNVTARVAADGQSIDFLAPGGARAIAFAGLKATDATGRELPVWFEDGSDQQSARSSPAVAGNSQFVSIVVTDEDAVYPLTIDPMATAPSWTGEGDQAGGEFGWSVAAAGDVNGDTYGDVIVGAPYYDNRYANQGRAFVYLGSAAGLSASPAWTAESDQADANFGYSVGTAGDVNQDGYDDVIVAAYRYDNGQTDEGRAYVYLGSAAGLSATPSWTAEGEQATAFFGRSVAAAGDVNGDGYDDVIVGAYRYDNGQTDEGQAYVYLGSAAGLSASPAWTAESDQATAYFGYSVASAGDVNFDSYDDVIVGALRYDNGQADEGRAYVYLGSAAGLSATPAWTAESDQFNAQFGVCVASAGDVDGDGYGDVTVGAHAYDNGQADEGRAFVYLGSAAGLSATPSWMAEGDQASANFGYSVATAGDVNDDGYSDVIVGAYLYDAGQADEGRAHIFLGSAAGLSPVPFWITERDQAGTAYGFCVASAGDVNGDGYSDVIVGAANYSNGQLDEGMAFMYLGAAESCPMGDMNCDCVLDFDDVPALVQALLDSSGYAAAYPGCNYLHGDMQPDGKLNGADVHKFVDLLIP